MFQHVFRWSDACILSKKTRDRQHDESIMERSSEEYILSWYNPVSHAKTASPLQEMHRYTYHCIIAKKIQTISVGVPKEAQPWTQHGAIHTILGCGARYCRKKQAEMSLSINTAARNLSSLIVLISTLLKQLEVLACHTWLYRSWQSRWPILTNVSEQFLSCSAAAITGF